MRYPRHYVVVTVLFWLILLMLGVYGFRENARMARAQEDLRKASIERGMLLYARNCAVCHGPQGEGVVGPPLNREQFRGDPAENSDTADFLRTTIANGRPGSSTPKWMRLPDGTWASFTAMPAWAKPTGPLNEQHINDLVAFIMEGDWKLVQGKIGEVAPPNIPKDRNALLAAMPDARGLPAEVNRAGKELFVNKGCITCHTLGSVGASIGPNLTNVGSWGIDDAFLKSWIRDPASVKNRAPQHWSNFVGDPQAVMEKVAKEKPMALPPTVMPKLPFTEAELETLTTYLMGLK